MNTFWIVLILLAIYLIAKNDPIIANYLKERIKGFKKYADDEEIKVLLPQLETAIEEAQKDNRWSIMEIVKVVILMDKIQRRINEINAEEPPEPEPELDIFKDKIVFGVEGANHLEAIKETGFNVVQSYTLIYRNDNQVRDFLDKCEEISLKCIPSLSAVFQGELSENKAKDFVNKWKSHSAVHSWYILDEPILHKIAKSEQVRIYNLVKSWDSNTKISMAIVSSNDEQKHKDYNCSDAYDILIADCYPVSWWNESGWETVEQLENCFGQGVRNVVKYANGKTVVPLMQAFYDKDLSKHYKPHGTVENQYDVWKNNGIKGNVGFYAWQYTKGPGLCDDEQLREEVKEFLECHKKR